LQVPYSPIAGLSLSVFARFVLGRNWSSAVAVKQEHELVQAGPYRVVRHPIYSGFLLELWARPWLSENCEIFWLFS
jgi:protein-S-isoprenylcysteine O-methyltransferase Ste14